MNKNRIALALIAKQRKSRRNAAIIPGSHLVAATIPLRKKITRLTRPQFRTGPCCFPFGAARALAPFG
jgi:hypothetical protein